MVDKIVTHLPVNQASWNSSFMISAQTAITNRTNLI